MFALMKQVTVLLVREVTADLIDSHSIWFPSLPSYAPRDLGTKHLASEGMKGFYISCDRRSQYNGLRHFTSFFDYSNLNQLML